MSNESPKPTLEKWLNYQRGALSDSDSEQIENYLRKFGVPPEFANSQTGITDDTLLLNLRTLGKPSLQVEKDVQAWNLLGELEVDSEELRNLVKTSDIIQKSASGKSVTDNIVIGPYRLIQKVSQTRMGRVYRGLDERSGDNVALKFPPEVLSERALDRFRREIRVTQKLSHPQIVTVIDELKYGSLPVFVMPWVDGIDLSKVVRSQHRLSQADVAEIGYQLVLILKYLKANNVVHRDIKPSNVLLTNSGQVLLIDLGLALLNQSEVLNETFTESIQIIGTMDYIAPEQARDAHSADFRADIYSLGCSLCKLVTGNAPFEKVGERHALKKILAHSLDPFPLIHLKYDGISKEFNEILMAMCLKSAEERLTDHELLANSFRRLSEGADLRDLYKTVDHLQIQNIVDPKTTLTKTTKHSSWSRKIKNRRYFTGISLGIVLSAFFTYRTALDSRRLRSKDQVKIIDLGFLSGIFSPSWGNDLARSKNVATGWAGSSNGIRAFRWDELDGMINLGTLGGFQSIGNSISADGSVIIGKSQDRNNQFQPFIWDKAKRMRLIGSFSGSGSANGISSDGSIVVGYSKNSFGNDRAFRWTSLGGMVDLGTLGGSSAVATSISADGTSIVGGSTNAAGNETAFIWSATTGMTSIGTLGGNLSYANKISDDGNYVVGWTVKKVGADPIAFCWSRKTGMIDLGLTSDKITSTALSISPDGYLVGGIFRASDNDPIAFLWSQKKGIDSLTSILIHEGIEIGSWSKFTEIRCITGNSMEGYNLVGAGVMNDKVHGFLIKGLFKNIRK